MQGRDGFIRQQSMRTNGTEKKLRLIAPAKSINSPAAIHLLAELLISSQ